VAYWYNSCLSTLKHIVLVSARTRSRPLDEALRQMLHDATALPYTPSLRRTLSWLDEQDRIDSPKTQPNRKPDDDDQNGSSWLRHDS
jgi:hypothetical protein